MTNGDRGKIWYELKKGNNGVKLNLFYTHRVTSVEGGPIWFQKGWKEVSVSMSNTARLEQKIGLYWLIIAIPPVLGPY